MVNHLFQFPCVANSHGHVSYVYMYMQIVVLYLFQRRRQKQLTSIRYSVLHRRLYLNTYNVPGKRNKVRKGRTIDEPKSSLKIIPLVHHATHRAHVGYSATWHSVRRCLSDPTLQGWSTPGQHMGPSRFHRREKSLELSAIAQTSTAECTYCCHVIRSLCSLLTDWPCCSGR